jgi:thioredoxin reductase
LLQQQKELDEKIKIVNNAVIEQQKRELAQKNAVIEKLEKEVARLKSAVVFYAISHVPKKI